MSLIASIQVHKCDRCEKIAVLHTDRDFESFIETWYANDEEDYCPDCREAQEAVNAD